MAPMKRPSSLVNPATSATLSLARVARRWHISQRELRHMLGRQQLGFVQVRGQIRVPVTEVKRLEKVRQPK